MVTWIHYVPIGTSLVAAIFSILLARRYRVRRNPQLLWWSVGVATYGLGAFFEAWITLLGNTVFLTKAWYVAGPILGGYPLAQGSVYLHCSRRFADRAAAITVPIIVVTSALVFLSPALVDQLEPHRPSGAILAWRWVRWMTPFVNLYASYFLIGGAFWSAWKYWRKGGEEARVVGNVLIGVGATLPGIGGGIAKAGTVEALYVLEFSGLILIWIGDRACARRHRVAVVPAA